MPIATSQSPPRTGTVAGVLEFLSFRRDHGFTEMGDVFETVLASSRFVFSGVPGYGSNPSREAQPFSSCWFVETRDLRQGISMRPLSWHWTSRWYFDEVKNPPFGRCCDFPEPGGDGSLPRGLHRGGGCRFRIHCQGLGRNAQAQGMSQAARGSGLSREILYKALSGEQSPSFGTNLKEMSAVGLGPGVKCQFET